MIDITLFRIGVKFYYYRLTKPAVVTFNDSGGSGHDEAVVQVTLRTPGTVVHIYVRSALRVVVPFHVDVIGFEPMIRGL